jgi:hypothetical protein
MEPLKPACKQLLAARTGADPADVDEYDALLAARFTEDPDAGAIHGMNATSARSRRLDELTRRLFPGGIPQRQEIVNE